MRTQIRLLVFVGYFFVAIGLLFLYRFIEKPRGGLYATSFRGHVLCWAESKRARERDGKRDRDRDREDEEKRRREKREKRDKKT